MHIILRNKPIQDKSYQELLSNVSMSTFSTYIYIFNRVQHTNFPYSKDGLPNTGEKLYKTLRKLESLGLIAIRLGDEDNATKTNIWANFIKRLEFHWLFKW